MSSVRDLVYSSRSVRRFVEGEHVGREVLLDLIDLARVTPSGNNRQSLKFALVHESGMAERIFGCLRWAAAIPGWEGPTSGERPPAYIVILGDTEIAPTFGCEQGIVAQTMLLGATERGLAGCIVGSVDRDRLRHALALDARFEILLVVALGRAAETVALEEVGPDGDVRYWRDDAGVHHVPKRSVGDIVIE